MGWSLDSHVLTKASFSTTLSIIHTRSTRTRFMHFPIDTCERNNHNTGLQADNTTITAEIVVCQPGGMIIVTLFCITEVPVGVGRYVARLFCRRSYQCQQRWVIRIITKWWEWYDVPLQQALLRLPLTGTSTYSTVRYHQICVQAQAINNKLI